MRKPNQEAAKGNSGADVRAGPKMSLVAIKFYAVAGDTQVVGVESQRSTPIVGLVHEHFWVVPHTQSPNFFLYKGRLLQILR